MATAKLMNKEEMLALVNGYVSDHYDGDLNICGYETYGKETYVYINCKTPELKKKVEFNLRFDGHRVCRYGIDTVVEVRVRYNKKAFGANK